MCRLLQRYFSINILHRASLNNLALFVLTSLITISCCEKNNSSSRPEILILSGQGNHEWTKTTPIIKRILSQSNLFSVHTTEKPDTLSFKSLQSYNAIISNWNTWPDNDFRMTSGWEHDFLKYIKSGGGAVFIHAGASSFYQWPEFHRTGIGRWGKETSHGQPQIGKMTNLDQNHIITKGIKDFYIFDELWKKPDIHPDAKAIGAINWTDAENGEQFTENALFISKTGKGKSLFIMSGHDERALLNKGLQTLIIRGTLWASGKNTMPEIPDELNLNKQVHNTYRWNKTDSSLSLSKGISGIWQFNFNNRYGRPYFHPVTADGSELTSADPPDHPWHLGLWFCWKYINEINYWEYLDEFKTAITGYRSAGITEINDIVIDQQPDFSADILMKISYHPEESPVVLTEESKIFISPPGNDRSYFIDYDNTYTAVEDVVLDRTPVQTEPGGRTWGGYAGLSVRFSQSLHSPFLLASSDTIEYKKNAWVYMGFNTLTGGRAGICIMTNPEYATPETSWYIIRTHAIPFFYFSPGVIYDDKKTLKKGEKLKLRYRSWFLPGEIAESELRERYLEFIGSK